MASNTCAAAQLPLRAKGQSVCPHHTDQNVTLVCHTCSELACVKCVTKTHKGHDFDDLQEAATAKKAVIQRYLCDDVEGDLRKLKEEISIFQCLLTKYTAKDRNTSEKDNTMCIFKTHMDEKQAVCSTLEENIAKCKVLLQTGTSIDIYYSDIEPYTPCATLSQLEITESRSSEPQNTQDNEKDRGDTKMSIANVPTVRSVGVAEENYYANVSKVHVNVTNKKGAETLGMNTEVIGGFDGPGSKFIIYDIAAAPDNTAWVCCRNSKFVTRFDSEGTVMEEWECEKLVNSVSVSPTTGNLWAASGKTVCEVTKAEIFVRFHLDKQCYCICVLENDHIVVGRAVEQLHEVSVFTADGERKLSTKVKGKPNKLTSCPLTRNIAALLFNSMRVSSSSILVMDNFLSQLIVVSLEQENVNATLACCLSYDGNGFLVVEAISIKDREYSDTLLLDGKGNYSRALVKSKRMDMCYQPVNNISKAGVYWRVLHETHGSPQKIQLLKY